nr:hypothetical protein [Thermus scotoductus]
MLSRIIAAFCIIDDALQALGYKDDPQAKTPASAILTLAILAAMELGGKHNKALALAKDLRLFTYVPSPSRFNRRLHALYPFFLPLRKIAPSGLTHLLAQAYALDTFPLPAWRPPLPPLQDSPCRADPRQGLPRLHPQQTGLLPRPQAPPPGGRREVYPWSARRATL